MTPPIRGRLLSFLSWCGIGRLLETIVAPFRGFTVGELVSARTMAVGSSSPCGTPQEGTKTARLHIHNGQWLIGRDHAYVSHVVNADFI